MESTDRTWASTAFGTPALILVIMLDVAGLLVTLVARAFLMGFLEEMGAQLPRFTGTLLALWYPSAFGALAICALMAHVLSRTREQRDWLLLGVLTASWGAVLYFPVGIAALTASLHGCELA